VRAIRSRPARREAGEKPWPPLHACALAYAMEPGAPPARAQPRSMFDARRPLSACQAILNVIGDLLADGCQVEEFLKGIFGFFGKLPIHGRLLS
jgi:hypothetical protein